MDKDFKRLTDFLVEMGIEEVPHTAQVVPGAPDRRLPLTWRRRAARRTSAGPGCSTRSTAPRNSRASRCPSSDAARSAP